MALTIYDDAGYDSFCTVAEADATISAFTLDSASWNALGATEKEAYLRIAFRVIIDGLPELPTLSDCLKQSQALIAVHDLVNNISKPTTVDGAIKKEKAGVVEVEYYETDNDVRTSNRIPQLAEKCLADLGYEFAASGLGFLKATLVRS